MSQCDDNVWSLYLMNPEDSLSSKGKATNDIKHNT